MVEDPPAPPSLFHWLSQVGSMLHAHGFRFSSLEASWTGPGIVQPWEGKVSRIQWAGAYLNPKSSLET